MRRALAACLICALAAVLSCTSIRLASREPYPAGHPVRGPEGSYQLTPPGDHWVRADWNEGAENIDWALAHQEGDAWLNVSVLPDRYASARLAFEHARAQADALMITVSREERELTVASPEGALPAHLGIYCGTFDRELRSRDSCIVLLATMRGDVTYALVGQLRVRDPEPGRQDELLRLMESLRLVGVQANDASGAGAAARSGEDEARGEAEHD